MTRGSKRPPRPASGFGIVGGVGTRRVLYVGVRARYTSRVKLGRFALRLAVLLAALASLVGCGGQPPPAASKPEQRGVGRGEADARAAAPEDAAAVPIRADDAVRGSRRAPVTLVVFSDFQSPFDARLVPTLERLREEYGSDKLRIVFKNDPLAFHPHARLAAEIGQGVLALGGQDAFWRYHDLAFRYHSALSPEAARSWAVAVGIDALALDDGLTRKRWAPKVASDLEVAHRLGVCGAPTAFINGVLISGAQPHDKLKQLIDAELANVRISRIVSARSAPS
jgi:protein-disulfide isomerase